MSTAMLVADCLFSPDTRFSEREVNLTPRSTDCEWQGPCERRPQRCFKKTS